MGIKLSSTLTENDIELDVGLIEWEDDKLNKIVDRCILIASSLMEGGGESPYPYQIEPMKRIFRSVLTNDGACITGLFSRQSGKCLGKGTRVIRYDGSVDVVENIKEGDLLMGDDSTPRKVSGLCKGIDDLYRIVPKSPRANPYVVNSEHIMSVIHNKYKGKHKLDISIKELLKDKYKSDIKQSRILGYQVPVTFPELNVALPIDPYILGIWLGCGTSSKSAITTMDEVIVDAWRKEAEKRGLKLRENVGANKNGELSKASTYNMSRVIVKKDTVNTFTEDLRKLNVMDNKHIPDIYKFGSEENRMAILSGIIDTNGHKPKCPSKKYVCELTLKEGKLADDIIFLARSLGFRVAVTTKVVRCKNYTRCFIYGELWKLPLRVPHKIYEYITPLREEPLHYGFDIEYIGKGEYYGFVLDANHRFLLEDFTVTHNTSLTAAVIGTLMIVSPLLSQQFPDKFPYFKKGIMIGVFAPTTDQVSTTHARVEKMLSHDTTNAILNDPDIRAAKKYDKGVIRILGNPKKIKGVIESDWTSFVRFQTADKRAKIESKSYQVIFIDECLTGDTIVKGVYRDIRLDEIKVGDIVYGYNGESIVEDVVVNTWNKGIKDVYELKIANGLSIKATSNHKIFTNRGWEYLGNIIKEIDNYQVLCYDKLNSKTLRRQHENNRGRISSFVGYPRSSQRRTFKQIRYKNNSYGRQKRQGVLSLYNSRRKRCTNETNKTFYYRLHSIQILRETYKILQDVWEKAYRSLPPLSLLLRRLQKEERLQHAAHPRVYGESKTSCKSLQQKEKGNEGKFFNITSVKKCGVENVYDIETAITHTFYANGILVHNCQEVDDTKISKSIRPMLAAYNGTSIYTGTPSPYVCEFYNAIMRNRAQDISKPAYLQNHFEYDYNITGKYNKRYKKYVEGEKENLGEDSDSFQMSYALKWLVEKGMALSPSDFQRYMADVRSDIEKSPVDGFQYVAGLDLGKGIDDPSVLTIARLEKNVNTGDVKKRIVFWKEFTNPSWEAQFTEVLIMLRAFNVCAVAVDSTGKGDPIAERLKAAMVDDPINVYATPFSTQSKHTLATDFYEEMYKNRISIPCGVKTKNTKEFKKFYGEWLTAVKTYTGKYLQLEHPRDLTGAHDDYVDSLLLLIQAAKKVHAHVVRQEYVDWRTTGSKLLPSEMYRSSQEYAKVRVNELFNKNK